MGKLYFNSSLELNQKVLSCFDIYSFYNIKMHLVKNIFLNVPCVLVV